MLPMLMIMMLRMGFGFIRWKDWPVKYSDLPVLN